MKQELKDYSKIPTEAFIYAAGFIDADGCITMHKAHPHNRYVFYCAFAQINGVSEVVLGWVRETFGGTISLRQPTQNSPKPQYAWELQGNRALPFLRGIAPFLKLKQYQAEIAIEFLETKARFYKAYMARGGPRNTSYTPEELDVLESYYQTMHGLHSKGAGQSYTKEEWLALNGKGEKDDEEENNQRRKEVLDGRTYANLPLPGMGLNDR